MRSQLSRAFVAAGGPDRGQEALAEALAFAWEHFEELREMENPAGYLYRVGQSRTRDRRRRVMFPSPGQNGIPDVEPLLAPALASLSERQRVCVVLVYAFNWTHQEVADLLEQGVQAIEVRIASAQPLDNSGREPELGAP